MAGKDRELDFTIRVDDVMKNVAWYIALPWFVGLVTEFQWAVLTFFLVAIGTSVANAYIETKGKQKGARE